MKNKLRKRQFFYRMFLVLSVLIFAFLFVLTGILELRALKAQNEKQTAELHDRAMNFSARLNQEVEKFANLAAKLNEVSWVRHVMSDSPILNTGISGFRRTEIAAEIGIYASILNRADSLHVVFPRHDQAIGKLGWTTLADCLSEIGIPGAEREKVLFLLRDESRSSVFSVRTGERGFLNSGMLLIQRIDATTAPRAKLLLFFSERSLLKFLSMDEVQMLESVRFYSSSGEDIYRLQGDGKNRGVGYTYQSAFPSMDLRYEIVLRAESAHPLLPLLILFSFLIGSMALAAGSGWLLTKRMYSPIQQLMTHVGVDAETVGDESEAMSRVFSRLMEDRQRNEQQVQQYLLFARMHYLQRLLWGEYDEERLEAKLREYCIPFTREMNYAVLLLHVGEKSVARRADLAALVQGTLAEMGMVYEWVEARENEFFAIVYQQDGETLRQMLEQLECRCQEMEAYGTGFDVLASAVASGMDALPILYQGLTEQYQQKNNLLAHIERRKQYFLPIGWEENLVHDVRAGNERGMGKTLVLLERENLRMYGDAAALRHLAVYLLSVIHRLLDETGIDSPDVTAAIGRAIAASAGAESFAAIRQAFELLCQERKAQYDRLVPQRAEQVRDYVQAHFCEYSLTQQAVAERFDMTASSMSKLFKSAYGVNFVDYLRNIRVDRAKELMAGGMTNLAQIAKAVGYENDLTFKRAFQKCETLTPHAYLQERARTAHRGVFR